MSVVIQNMGPVSRKKGVCAYDVRINCDFVARCFHSRKEGLAKLLRVAADAVDAKGEKR